MRTILCAVAAILALGMLAAENRAPSDGMTKPERAVKVLGAVNNPGWVPMPAGRRFTILEAITRAGGPTRYAELRAVRLTHKVTVEVDVQAMIRNSDPSQHVVIQDGDTILVPVRQ